MAGSGSGGRDVDATPRRGGVEEDKEGEDETAKKRAAAVVKVKVVILLLLLLLRSSELGVGLSRSAAVRDCWQRNLTWESLTVACAQCREA